jgi:hypothetical protein
VAFTTANDRSSVEGKENSKGHAILTTLTGLRMTKNMRDASIPNVHDFLSRQGKIYSSPHSDVDILKEMVMNEVTGLNAASFLRSDLNGTTLPRSLHRQNV